MDYKDQLRHPQWQRRRLERLSAAGWQCTDCGARDEELHVHHDRYIIGRMAWEYEDALLLVVCHSCHAARHGKAPTRTTGRRVVAVRGQATLLERAIWLTLQSPTAWAAVRPEVRLTLLEQPAPYGPIFECVDRFVEEFGLMSGLAVLNELSGTLDDEGLAVLARVRAFHDVLEGADTASELSSAVDRIKLQAIEAELKLLFSAPTLSGDAQARGKELMVEQSLLKYWVANRVVLTP